MLVPALMIPPEALLRMPSNWASLFSVRVRTAPPRLALAPKVSLPVLVALPRVALPVKETAFRTVRAVVLSEARLPPLKVSVPTPIGLLVIAPTEPTFPPPRAKVFEFKVVGPS